VAVDDVVVDNVVDEDMLDEIDTDADTLLDDDALVENDSEAELLLKTLVVTDVVMYTEILAIEAVAELVIVAGADGVAKTPAA
jgi:hypothetical protein